VDTSFQAGLGSFRRQAVNAPLQHPLQGAF